MDDTVRRIARLLHSPSTRALLVGGCVRDQIMGATPKDYDVEVYGLAPDDLMARLSAAGFGLDLVGKSFGVLKIKGTAIDVSIPRRESKSGSGHKGFAIHSDPHLSPAEAALRRDFTINALYQDPLTREILDFCRGREDLRQRILRPCSERFKEDPLRVLRAMQFIARFDLQPADQLLAYSREMTMEGLPAERICEEFGKFLLQGRNLKAGLDFLRDSTWLRFFPELAALVGVPQDPEWHPEGDVFTHTGHCLNQFARVRSGVAQDDLILGLAVLLHDVAKPQTTVWDGGRWRSPGHEELGRGPAEKFLRALTREEEVIHLVVELAANHMMPMQLYKSGAKDAAVRRLAMRVGRLDLLAKLATCDKRGRPPLEFPDVPETDWLLQTAERLAIADQKPKPILLGRHLLALGWQPGPSMGKVLHEVFEAQLDGHVGNLDEALALAKTLEPTPP